MGRLNAYIWLADDVSVTATSVGSSEDLRVGAVDFVVNDERVLYIAATDPDKLEGLAQAAREAAERLRQLNTEDKADK